MYAKTTHERISLSKVKAGDRLSTRLDETLGGDGRVQPEKGDGQPRTVADVQRIKTPQQGGPATVEYVLTFTDGTATEPRYGTTSHYRLPPEPEEVFDTAAEEAKLADLADEYAGIDEPAEPAEEVGTGVFVDDVLIATTRHIDISDRIEPDEDGGGDTEEEAQLEAGIIESGLVVHDGDLDAALADLAAEFHLEETLAEVEAEIAADPASDPASRAAEPAGQDGAEPIDPAPLPPAEQRPKAARKKPDPVPAGPDVTVDLTVPELALLYATMGRFGWREFDTWGAQVAPFDVATGEPFPEPPVLPGRRVGKLLEALDGHAEWLDKQTVKGKPVSEDLVYAVRVLRSKIAGQLAAAEKATAAAEPAAEPVAEPVAV